LIDKRIKIEYNRQRVLRGEIRWLKSEPYGMVLGCELEDARLDLGNFIHRYADLVDVNECLIEGGSELKER